MTFERQSKSIEQQLNIIILGLVSPRECHLIKKDLFFYQSHFLVIKKDFAFFLTFQPASKGSKKKTINQKKEVRFIKLTFFQNSDEF